MKAIREAVAKKLLFKWAGVMGAEDDTLLTLANDVLEGRLSDKPQEQSDDPASCRYCGRSFYEVGIVSHIPAKKEMSEERIVDINKTIEPLKEIRGRYETQSNATLYDFAVENRDKINQIIDRLNKEEGGK